MTQQSSMMAADEDRISQRAVAALAAGASPTRVFRLEAGLPLALLAARANLSIERLERIESGSPPRLDELLALARVLSIPAEWLFDEEREYGPA